MELLPQLVAAADKNKATALRVSIGSPPFIRINGEWKAVRLPPFQADDLAVAKAELQALQSSMPSGTINILKDESTNLEIEWWSE